jgi:anti-sigma factor RsiW
MDRRRVVPEREDGGVSEHPSLEILSAYVDGRVDDRQRAEVEAHLARCEGCYKLVKEVVLTGAEIEAAIGTNEPASTIATASKQKTHAQVVPLTRRRWVVIGAAGLTMAATLLLYLRTTRIGSSESTSDNGVVVQQLVDAVGQQRFFDARLTGGFQFGPLRSPLRSGSSETRSLPLLAVVADLERRVQAEPSPALLHSFGVGLLLTGDLEDAIRQLESAAEQRADSPAFLCDLGAAYLTKAEITRRSEDWAAALAASDRALVANPRQPEALFNRALALMGLQRANEARAAWNAYLAHDSVSSWSEEARRRLKSIDNLPGGR